MVRRIVPGIPLLLSSFRNEVIQFYFVFVADFAQFCQLSLLLVLKNIRGWIVRGKQFTQCGGAPKSDTSRLNYCDRWRWSLVVFLVILHWQGVVVVVVVGQI
jgi:hypothetical protein